MRAEAEERLKKHKFSPFKAPASEMADGPLPYSELFATMRENMLRVYGPISFQELNLFGKFLNKTSLLTNDPAVIKSVLVDQSEAYRRTDPTMRILSPVLGNGLFLSEGEEWRFQRRTMAPAFAPRAMDIVTKVALEVADHEADELESGTQAGGKSVDFLRLMQSIALEVAGVAMFSMPMGERGPRLRSLFEGYGVQVGRPFPLDMVLPRGMPSPTDFKRRRLGRKWLDFVAALLEERARMPASAGARDLYDLLVSAQTKDGERGFNRRELRDQFATMIIAGHETTALTLLWAMIMLARSPSLQSALAEEAASFEASSDEPAKSLDKLVLTRAVVMETLRLFPPAFLIVREARKKVELAGRELVPGDIVNVAPWVLQRHEAHWHKPGEFDPRRFMPGAPAIDKYAYLPFGAGPRVCIGMSFALCEAIAVIATLMRRFEISMTASEEIQARAVVTTYPDPIPTFTIRRRIPIARAA